MQRNQSVTHLPVPLNDLAALLKAHLPGPVDVHYGNEALDEMCFAAITLFYKAADAP